MNLVIVTTIFVSGNLVIDKKKEVLHDAKSFPFIICFYRILHIQ